MAGGLPDIVTLRRRCQALAMLDAILSPEWESRYYSFTTSWADGEQIASMRNGSGDEYSIVFTPAGVFIRGFDHESPMSPAANDEQPWPGLLDGLPDVFEAQAAELAFSYGGQLEATFCLWRRTADDRWQAGVIDFPNVDGHRTDPDGSGLLSVLCDGSGQAYRSFAADYHESQIDHAAVTHICALRPLTQDVVASLNPERALDEITDEMGIIGYPHDHGAVQ